MKEQTSIDIKQLMAFSQAIARQAGAMMLAELQAQGGPEKSYKHAGQEMVTEADIKVDRLICDAIRDRYPDHQILAEESAPDINQLSSIPSPLWIIDPIDGTVNYAHDHGHSAVSIAWLSEGRVISAVVYNPFSDEMFHAIEGQGAFINDTGIKVGEKQDLRRALFATGFPYIKEDMQRLVQRLDVMLQHCADLRRIGSAALDICWVAMGRLDIYYENLSVWDFAAAQLIAREAGAQYGHFLPVPEGVSPVLHNKNILVANPVLFEKARELLAEIG